MRLTIATMLFTLNFVDAIITTYLCKMYGSEIETSFIAKYYIEQFGTGAFLIKILIGFLSCFLIYKYWNKYRITRIAYPVAAIYFCIFVYHLLNITEVIG